MADLSYVVVYRGGSRGYGLRYLILEVEQADQNDTVTVDELNTVADTLAIETDSGAAVACTESGNVVTVGAAITDKPLAIMVSGY